MNLISDYECKANSSKEDSTTKLEKTFNVSIVITDRTPQKENTIITVIPEYTDFPTMDDKQSTNQIMCNEGIVRGYL